MGQINWCNNSQTVLEYRISTIICSALSIGEWLAPVQGTPSHNMILCSHESRFCPISSFSEKLLNLNVDSV
jgi:hypothetical protein